jgi:hypothetical protein
MASFIKNAYVYIYIYIIIYIYMFSRAAMAVCNMLSGAATASCLQNICFPGAAMAPMLTFKDFDG